MLEVGSLSHIYGPLECQFWKIAGRVPSLSGGPFFHTPMAYGAYSSPVHATYMIFSDKWRSYDEFQVAFSVLWEIFPLL